VGRHPGFGFLLIALACIIILPGVGGCDTLLSFLRFGLVCAIGNLRFFWFRLGLGFGFWFRLTFIGDNLNSRPGSTTLPTSFLRLAVLGVFPFPLMPTFGTPVFYLACHTILFHWGVINLLEFSMSGIIIPLAILKRRMRP
jgi:hypothetical protein